MIISSKIFENTIKEFEEKILPIKWTPRGILVSEGFAFCAIAKKLEVKSIFESGIYNGRSTLIWAKFFNFPYKNTMSVDFKIRKEAIKNVGKRVQLVKGNSFDFFDFFADQNKRIAVFIDGPKKQKAIDLAKKVINNPNVVMIGIHDVDKMNITRKLIQYFNPKFYTDNEEFVKKYSYLDKKDSQKDINQDIQWEPYRFVSKRPEMNRNLGSYGPTIGFIW